EALRLSVALALIGRPRLLAVDDTDLKLSDAEREQAWALLRSVADAGTTVLAVCSEAPGNTQVVRTAPADGEAGVEEAATAPADDEAGVREPATEEPAAEEPTTEEETADALAEARRA
ncbi:ABC transporter ATP-binding protein, partial [Streptomyces sp. SID5614]|nr:ABC transporter ATP-binding protein [Streptomyces sp. SID5614]